MRESSALSTPVSLSLPAAARFQGVVTADDSVLQRAAMSYRPGVKWWWGVRRAGIDNYAHCYLCDAAVVHWSGHYPITQAAIALIQSHRLAHIEHGLRLD